MTRICHASETQDDGEDGAESLVFSIDSSYWSVWRTAEALLEQLATDESNSSLRPYESTTRQVVQVLNEWGRQWAGKDDMKSFLRKTALLLHETEESIVALHHLRAWWKSASIKPDPFIAVDVCCGKGYFSMFLSYLVGMFWREEDEGTNLPKLERIILVDKADTTEINWQHIDCANASARSEGRPVLELWPGTNIHAYDELLVRLQRYGTPLALTGIHLCKMLSPAFVSIVNGLGNEQCPYMCLAPCCLPRRVTKKDSKTGAITSPRMISVYRHETASELRRRKDYNALRQQPRPCYLCHEHGHLVRNCPLFPAADREEQSRILQAAAATAPCWMCGLVGHFSVDCPTPNMAKPSTSPPMLHIDASHVVHAPRPFIAYCELLPSGLEGKTATVVESGIIHRVAGSLQQENHWNASRKSVYIVATTTTG